MCLIILAYPVVFVATPVPVGQCPVYMSVHHANRRHSCIYINSDIEVGGVLHSNGVVSCGALVRVLGTITNASEPAGSESGFHLVPSKSCPHVHELCETISRSVIR